MVDNKKEHRTFVRRVFLLILAILVLICTNVAAVRNFTSQKYDNIVKNFATKEKDADKKKIEIAKTDVKDEKKSDLADENSKKDTKEEKVEVKPEDNAKVQENTEKKEEIPDNAVSDDKYRYTKLAGINVYPDTDPKSKNIDLLIQGVRVKLLEQKDIVTQKDKKIKGKDGKIKIEKIDVVNKWDKISYRKNNEGHIGWIRSGNLESSIYKLLPDSWKNLDFSKIEKKNYPENKKIDVKGIYVSAASAGLTSRLDSLIAFAKRTKINTFVIDVKDDSGYLLFNMEVGDKYSLNANKYNQIKDIEAFMKKLKDNGIYTIARIVSFKDPSYAKKNPDRTIFDNRTKKAFVNKDNVTWVSPHDRDLWAYNIAVAKEAAKVGFNEIQFDYVRFPATGGEAVDKNINYRNTQNESKPVAIQRYLKYAREELEPLGIYIGADVYGQIGSMPNDMEIGQYWESISNVVDFISPMVYPSHYTNGVYGIKVPDAEPYNTVYRCVKEEINRNENIDTPAAIRPWIQAFTAKWVKGFINYGYPQIEAQIKALDDLGIKQYILWSPTNRYSIAEKNPPKEETKKEEAKKEEVKKEEVKKEEPKKDEVKKEEIKKEEPKKVEPKKEEPKKDNTAKPEDPKKVELKITPKTEPKAEPKTDTTVQPKKTVPSTPAPKVQPAPPKTQPAEAKPDVEPALAPKKVPEEKTKTKLIDRFKKVTN